MEIQDLAKEQLDKLDSVLDEYERGMGLPLYSSESQDESIKKYMTLSRTEIEKINP